MNWCEVRWLALGNLSYLSIIYIWNVINLTYIHSCKSYGMPHRWFATSLPESHWGYDRFSFILAWRYIPSRELTYPPQKWAFWRWWFSQLSRLVGYVSIPWRVYISFFKQQTHFLRLPSLPGLEGSQPAGWSLQFSFLLQPTRWGFANAPGGLARMFRWVVLEAKRHVWSQLLSEPPSNQFCANCSLLSVWLVASCK